MMSPAYQDVRRHMSQEVQGAMVRVATTAATVLPAEEVMMAMVSAAVDAACSAIASMVGSCAVGSTIDDDLLRELLDGYCSAVRNREGSIRDKIALKLAGRHSPAEAAGS